MRSVNRQNKWWNDIFTIILLVVEVLYRCKNGELKLGNICLFEVAYFILKHEKYFYLQAEVLFLNSFKWIFISYFRGHGKWENRIKYLE